MEPRLKFRTVFVLVVVVLLAATLGSTVVVVARVVDSAAHRAVRADLLRAHGVLADQLAAREETIRAKATVVSREPRVKAVVAAHDITPATMRDVSERLLEAAESDILILADADGELLVDVTRPDATSVSDTGLIASALRDGGATAIWIRDGRVLMVAARRIDFDVPVGVLAIGYEVDHSFAATMTRQTGSSLVITYDGDPIVSSLDPGSQISAHSGAIGPEPTRVELGDTSYLAISSSLEEVGDGGVLEYLVLRSLDEALAPGKRLKLLLFLVGGLALLAGIVASALLARHLSRPLSDLVRFAKRVGTGDLRETVAPSRLTELSVLGRAFNDMAASLSSSYSELEQKNTELEAQRTALADAAVFAKYKAVQLEDAYADLAMALEERKRTQAQLVQSGKLAALGELAAGVAHEINNPLSAVLTYSLLINEQLSVAPPEVLASLPELPRQLALVERGAERCKSIADNLLTFGRQSNAQMAFVCMADVIERTLELVGVQLRHGRVRLRKEVDGGLEVLGHLGELQQVVTNLAINAAQAMGEGGWLTIRSFRASSGDVVLEVADTGPGIPDDVRERVFDPFFTTKPTGKGTGLGLSIVYGIIERHDGAIEVDSEIGRGTTFTVTLPAAPADQKRAQLC